MCVFVYCDVWDILDLFFRNIVLQVYVQYVLGLFLSKVKILFKILVNIVSLYCIQIFFKIVYCLIWLSNQ